MSKSAFRIQICQNLNRLPCQDCPQNTCMRGFFSIFLSVLYGIAWAKKRGLDFHIDLNDKEYAYSQAQAYAGDLNFLHYYFDFPKELEANFKGSWIDSKGEDIFPHRIWLRPFYRELKQVFTEELQLEASIETQLKTWQENQASYRVLGLHLRGTDHIKECPPPPWAWYKDYLSRVAPKFDKVFIASDEQNLVEKVQELLGEDKVIRNSFQLSKDQQALHHANPDFPEKSQLGREALLDALCLANCDEALLVDSNLSFGALIFNPELSYTLMPDQNPNLIKRRWKKIRRFLLSWRLYVRWKFYIQRS